MKITILNGSPRHNGNTQIMADTFAKAAQENGHTATVLTLQIYISADAWTANTATPMRANVYRMMI